MALYLNNLNLNKNQLQKAVVHPLGAAPPHPAVGQIYYDTGNASIYVCTALATNGAGTNGTWLSLGGDMTGVTLTGGNGITATNTNSSAGEFSSTITLDISDSTLTTETSIAQDDLLAFSDESATDDPTKNISFSSLEDQIFSNINSASSDIAIAAGGAITVNTAANAATVTGAAQSNITSLGTLTTLTVDNVIINGTTIGHTSDTDLITLANGKVTITGDLDIIGSGTSTIIESSTVAIADSMLKLAKDQGASADAVDFGFYGQYGVGGTAKYAGIFRDVNVPGDPFTFFDGLEAEPGTTVNTSGTGYDLADIVAANGNFESLTIPDNAIAVGKIAGGTLPSDVKVTNANWTSTDLSVANGGTGRSTFTAKAILLGNGANGINELAAGSAGQVLTIDASGNPTFSANTGSVAAATVIVANQSANDAEMFLVLNNVAGDDNAHSLKTHAGAKYNNETGYITASGFTAGNTSVNTTGLELGHANDTTITRSAAGKVAIEGNLIGVVKTFSLNDTGAVQSNNDGAASTVFTITHGMGASFYYKVEVIKNSGDYETVFVDVARPTNATITVSFANNVALGDYAAMVTRMA
jgi:hypothetical protein